MGYLFKSNFMFFVLLFFISCQNIKEQKNEMKSFPNWEAIADKLLERSDLVKEEKVVLMAKPGEFDPLIELLAEKINKTGAIYLGTFSVNSSVKPVKWETDFIRKAKGKKKKDLTDYLMQVDLGIMMPGASPSDVEYASMQDVLRRDKGRTIHFTGRVRNIFRERLMRLTT